MGINGGRNRFGEEDADRGTYEKYTFTMPQSLSDRLTKFMREQERNRSWCIQKALDAWLKKQGY